MTKPKSLDFNLETLESPFDHLTPEQQIDVLRRTCIELVITLSTHAHIGSEQSVVVPMHATEVIQRLRYPRDEEPPNVGTA